MSEEKKPNSTPLVSGDSVVVAAENQISSDLAGEAVILDLKAGMYYGLDAVGSRIWSLIQQPTSVNELRQALLREYEVDAERCEQDLMTLLRDLAANKLIRVHNESAP